MYSDGSLHLLEMHLLSSYCILDPVSTRDRAMSQTKSLSTLIREKVNPYTDAAIPALVAVCATENHAHKRLTGVLMDRTLKPLPSLGVDPEQIAEHMKGVPGAIILGDQVRVWHFRGQALSD